MKSEQINEEVTVTNRQLAHLWHIRERVKNKDAIAKHVLDNVNQKTYLSVPSADQHIRRELMIEPGRRSKDSIGVLVKATSFIPFFQNLMKEPVFEENGIHEQLCRKIILLDEVRGQPICLRSSPASRRRQGRPHVHLACRRSRHLQTARPRRGDARRAVPRRRRQDS